METTQTLEIIKWIIAIGLVSAVSTIGSVIAIIRSGKLLPKELKSADLENKSKEASIANQFDELATKAAEKAVKSQERYDELETRLNKKYDTLKDVYDALNENMEKLTERMEAQDAVIESQNKVIHKLTCEVNNYKIYTKALIKQLGDAKLIPVEMSAVEGMEDCDKENGDKIRRQKKKLEEKEEIDEQTNT